MRLRFRTHSISAWWADLKGKIRNFDIKPIKPIIPDLLQQANAAIENREYVLAEKILRKALAINNTNYDALLMASELYIGFGCVEKAIHLLKHAVKIFPQEAIVHQRLGYLYSFQGKLRASAKAYKRVVDLRPDSMEAQHFFAAAKKQKPNHAPPEYIVNLFNIYADHFEDSLLTGLSYQAHINLVAYLREMRGLAQPIASVLDLGCGTGLLGQELLRYFKIQHLSGVDLSPNMIELARVKNIYHTLHNQGLVEYLQVAEPEVDLIASSDVFVYLGNLSSVFEHCYRILKPGGYFCFSTEQLAWGDYKLTTTGRYQHSLRYLKSLYKQYQFSKMYSQTIDLRKESGNIVTGYLCLLQK